MTLELVPMTPEEFDRRSADLQARYAEDLRDARGMTADAAAAEAAEATRAILPDGVRTDRALVRAARVDGRTVGWVWVMLPGVGGRPEMAWLYNIDIDPDHQGKGYGRALMLAVEAELRRLGVATWGLNVFGGNTRAVGLYESLGFRVTSQQMAKTIGDGSA
jgi:ribosomal protein S18 acetylase RimI-like enzyme